MVKTTHVPTQPTVGALDLITGQPIPDISYDESHFSSLFDAEDRHFWFQARNHIIAALVKQLVTEYEPGYRFLEIGCGNGNVLRELEQVCTTGTVIGMDLFAEGLQYARQRVAAPLVQADIYAPPFKTQFEMVGLFDVLEHLPDDKQILAHLQTMLPPGGAILITVPAYMSLWSYADRLANHKRRYTREELTEKLAQNGFRAAYVTYYMMSILPIVWFRRKLANYLIARSQTPAALEHDLFQRELKIRPGINKTLASALNQEARLVTRRRVMPFGTSLLALAYRE